MKWQNNGVHMNAQDTNIIKKAHSQNKVTLLTTNISSNSSKSNDWNNEPVTSTHFRTKKPNTKKNTFGNSKYKIK